MQTFSKSGPVLPAEVLEQMDKDSTSLWTEKSCLSRSGGALWPHLNVFGPPDAEQTMGLGPLITPKHLYYDLLFLLKRLGSLL